MDKTERMLMVTCDNDDFNFKKAMEYLFNVEGGYSNHKNDRGGATNFGITQKTYDYYRKKNKLAPRSVKQIEKTEALKIYYEDYWVASGANKIQNFSLALILFDSCVNHGVSVGKSLYLKSAGNVDLFLQLRREKYKSIVERNPTQKVFYAGWLNRLKKLENYINSDRD